MGRLDVYAGDISHLDLVGGDELPGGPHGRMVPGAAGIALPGDIVGHDIVPADIVNPAGVFLEAKETGNAGETPGRQLGGGDAGHGPPADAVLDHGWVVDVAHHGQIGRVVLGNAQRVLDLPGRQAQQVGGDGGAGYRAPRAAGLVDLVGLVPDTCGAVGHLVPDNHGGHHGRTTELQRFGQGQCRGKDLRPGVALGIEGAVVNVDAVGSVAIAKGSADGRGPLVVQQDGGLVTGPGSGSVFGGDGADGRQCANQRRPQRVQQGQAHTVLDRRLKRLPGERVNKVGNQIIPVHAPLLGYLGSILAQNVLDLCLDPGR